MNLRHRLSLRHLRSFRLVQIFLLAQAILLFTPSPGTAQWSSVTGPSIPFDRQVMGIAIDDSGNVFAATDQGVVRSNTGGAFWEWTGLGARYAYCITIDSAGTIFAGTNYGVERSHDGGKSWELLGGSMGSITTLLVVSPEIILAGTYGGMHRSTDGGASWSVDMPTLAFPSMTLIQPGVILAGTSDGLYRSTDSGNTWEARGLSMTWINSVAADSNGNLFASSYTLYRSTDQGVSWNQLSAQGNVYEIVVNDSGTIFTGGYEGFSYSFDAGLNWSRVEIKGRTVYAMAFGDSSRVYAGTETGVYYLSLHISKGDTSVFKIPVKALMEESDGTLLAGTTDGVHRSSDGGVTWVPSGLSGKTIKALGRNNFGKSFAGSDSSLYRSTDAGMSWGPPQLSVRTTLAIAGKDTGYVFAGENDGIHRSTDGGETWSLLFSSILARGIVASDGGKVVAATIAGAWTSTDNGDNWSWYNTGDSKCVTRGPTGTYYLSADYGFFRSSTGVSWTSVGPPFNAAALAADSQTVFAAVGLEILSSTNSGSSWSSVKVFPATVRSLLIQSGTLLVGTDVGIYLIPAVASGKVDLHTGIVSGELIPVTSVMTSGTNNLFMATPSTLYRSTDGGTSWDANLVVGSGSITQTAQDGAGTIYAGGNGIFRSTDNGEIWTRTSVSSVTMSAIAASTGHIWGASYDVLFHSSDAGISWVQSTLPSSVLSLKALESGILYAGTYQGVYRSTDFGSSWTRSGPSVVVSSLVVDPSNNLYAATAGGVQRSTDGGETWTIFTNELSGKSVSFLGGTESGFLIAGSSGGLMVSGDQAQEWVLFEEGLDSTASITGLAVGGPDLYLGTNKGMWKRPAAELAATGIDEQASIPGSFALEQNYPNPFNPRTSIRYNMPSAGKVRLHVFDILGRLVAVLVDKEESAGTHTIQWNAPVASGVYFYQLEITGKEGVMFRDVRKMVLMK